MSGIPRQAGPVDRGLVGVFRFGERDVAGEPGAADIELGAADLAELDALPAPQGARY